MKTATHQRRRIAMPEHALELHRRELRRCKSLLRDARVPVYAKITDQDFNRIVREEFRGLWKEIERALEDAK